VRAHHAIGDGHRRFTIICPGEGPVYRALEVCGLHDVLRVYPSRAAAGAA
jgi:hypothetical protein